MDIYITICYKGQVTFFRPILIGINVLCCFFAVLSKRKILSCHLRLPEWTGSYTWTQMWEGDFFRTIGWDRLSSMKTVLFPVCYPHHVASPEINVRTRSFTLCYRPTVITILELIVRNRIGSCANQWISYVTRSISSSSSRPFAPRF